MFCRLYCLMHKYAKIILRKNITDFKRFQMVDFNDRDFDGNQYLDTERLGIKECVNEFKPQDTYILKNQVYPKENLVVCSDRSSVKESYKRKHSRLHFCGDLREAATLWQTFIDRAVIPEGYRNAGLCYAGYIHEYQAWCLPSWIWTNAAAVRYFCSTQNVTFAKCMGDILLDLQTDCGGWIVRNDYGRDSMIPQLAPNDSAYIANNACLSLYDATKDVKYLDAARGCAEWIMETARPDGFVYLGFDTKNQVWLKDKNIVDTGFTAGLFARMYEITGEEKYKGFLSNFIDKYIELFYDTDKKLFATAINAQDRRLGGSFGRGQAWALEGLIPAWRVLQSEELKQIIQNLVDQLLLLQTRNGGWAYNFDKPLMGVDCKAVPVIAYSLLKWYECNMDKRIFAAVKKALKWSACHTSKDGEGMGGIFSFTMEGAVVHHLYTNTAFVYSSVYALEVKNKMEKESI